MLLNRFMWEDLEKGPFRENKRIRCILKFEEVIKVYFIRTNNDKVCVEVEEGTTLMQAAKQAEIKEIPADCGGN